MSEYTLGPWKNLHFNMHGDIVITSPNWHNQSTCDQMVKVTPRRNYVDGFSLHVTEDAIKEAEANARLIAAAPELLDALKRLTRVACVEFIKTRPDVIEQASAAIAKAEGFINFIWRD